MLIMNFENFLNKSHLTNKTLQEISTRRIFQILKPSAHRNKHEMFPEKTKVPNNANPKTDQTNSFSNKVISLNIPQQAQRTRHSSNNDSKHDNRIIKTFDHLLSNISILEINLNPLRQAISIMLNKHSQFEFLPISLCQ